MSASAATRYVWQGSPSPAPPYDTWANAAHDIQTAVDAALAGDEIVVANGVSPSGGSGCDSGYALSYDQFGYPRCSEPSPVHPNCGSPGEGYLKIEGDWWCASLTWAVKCPDWMVYDAYCNVCFDVFGEDPGAGTLPAQPQSQPADDFNPGASGHVYSLAVQADGKILVGGAFGTLGGQARNGIGRVNRDGTLDTTFNPGANILVYCLAVQADGKILVGGAFTTLAGQTRNRIGRLNGDGTLDATFDPGANAEVRSLTTLEDGKILVGGDFTTLGGQTRLRLGRLHSDGRLDLTFDPGANSEVRCLAVQEDGKILVGGDFTMLGGQPRLCIGRLNGDGTLDTSFNPGAAAVFPYYPAVCSLALQPDGKILVGGSFTMLAGQQCPRIGRLHGDGTLDTTFAVGANGPVVSLVVQADGQFLVGGNPWCGSYVSALAVQDDGEILVGGDFWTLGGQPRTHLGRLHNTEPATQSLSCEGATLTWLRGGSSPEVWRTSFDACTNGNDWVSLGAGTRIPGGWQLTDVAVPANATLRAQGFVAGGQFNGSSGLVETNIVTTPPYILAQPNDQTNNVGADLTFSIVAEGTPTLQYQWRKDRSDITDATNTSLTLNNVQESDQGLYWVLVSNAFGSVTSSPALLMVNQAPVADASATRLPAVSANGVDATVILDASRSSDPDGDLLQYLWLSTLNPQPSTLLASGLVAVVQLPMGVNPLLLVVDDGVLTSTNTITVEVITAAQAVQRLIAQVESEWRRSQPLVATLSAALASFERGNSISAANQLHAFQNKVRAQVERMDAELANELIAAAQQILDSITNH